MDPAAEERRKHVNEQVRQRVRSEVRGDLSVSLT